MKPHHKRSHNPPPGTQDKPGLYGFHAVREAWLNPARAVRNIYIADQAAKGFEATLMEGKKKNLRRPAPLFSDKRQIDKILPAGAVHQGLALSCEDLPEVNAQDLVIKTKDKSNPVLLMLDQVTDPHNVGAILRSACAFGVEGVIMQTRHAPELEGALAKAACGAIEHVPVAYETNLSRALEELKEGGYFVIGLDERGQKNIDEYVRGAKPGKTVLVLGAEGPGMRRLVGEHCDLQVRLPMSSPMPSINVSNAAAVALYALSGKN